MVKKLEERISMVRFKLSNPQCWSSWAAGEKLCIWVELDEETNKELTTQMCEGNPQDDLRACNVQLVYNAKEETLKILDAALEEFDPETGEAVDAPFGNPDWVDEISLEMNSDEVAYIQENLETILEQLTENKKNG